MNFFELEKDMIHVNVESILQCVCCVKKSDRRIKYRVFLYEDNLVCFFIVPLIIY